MCGIVGFSSLEPFDVDKINTLMYINSIKRGEDCTGIYSPLNGLKKSLDAGWKFVTGKDKLKPDKILLAHVRSKTVGGNSIENAHPFKKGNWYLIHNGTLKNHWQLLKKYGLSFNAYNVDSEIITGCIAEDDNLEIIKEIDGAAAFVIHDDRHSNRLYVFRNEERPLFKGYVGASMYISSIEESLKLIGCVNIKEFKKDYLYTIEDGSIIGNPIKIKNTPYEEPKTSYHYNHHNNTPVVVTMSDKLALGCWVRSNYTCTYWHEGKKIELSNKEYYEITEVLPDNRYEIYDIIKGCKLKVNKYQINQTDIIKDGDYVKALYDITNRHLLSKKITQVDIKKDQIVIAICSHCDGDLAYTANNIAWNYAKKNQFIKLNDEELKAHKKLLNVNVTNINEDDATAGCETLAEFIDIQNSLNLGEDNQEESTQDIINNNNQSINLTLGLTIDELDQELTIFYPKMGMLLEDLEEELKHGLRKNKLLKNSVMKKIAELNEILYGSYNSAYPYIEEDNTEQFNLVDSYKGGD